MPFDVMAPIVNYDVLDDLGIIPIPVPVTLAYKQAMLRRHASNYPRWIEVTLPNEMLADRLAHIDYSAPLPRRASAPLAVIRIAELVRRNRPDARFRLGYLATDPYLTVSYPGCLQDAYLGIWRNRRMLVAIARRNTDPSLAMQRLTTLFG